MARERYVLVIRGDGSARVARHPRIANDEVAFPLIVDIPDGWGRILVNSPIEVQMPDPPSAVTVGQPILPPEPEDES